MTESSLKSGLTDLLRKELMRFVIIRHEDKSTYGIPDWSITGNGKTSWFEGKFANPDFKSHGAQELMMKRLANVGHHARYIIWDNTMLPSIRIVHPADLKDWKTSGEVKIGFDNQWILQKIREAHYNAAVD